MSLPSLEQLRESEARYLARKKGETKAQPPTESQLAYSARIKAREAEERDTSVAALLAGYERSAPKTRFVPYPYTADELQPLALRIHTAKLAALGRNLSWQKGEEDIFRGLLSYFAGDNDSPYPLHRGIYLFGRFGAGKTLLMQTMQQLLRLAEDKLLKAGADFTPRSFSTCPAKDIAFEMQRQGSVESLRPYMGGRRLFDDLGNEDEKKVYGNQVNAMAEILLARYHSWQACGLVSHCTSNLPPHQCAEVYGERIGSRVFELFNHVFLPGEDKRRSS